jgi:preprotein translocase subunit SecF
MIIVKHRLVFFILTGALVLVSFISVAVYGLKFSTDFTGGTLVEATYPGGRPTTTELTEAVHAAGIEGFSLREAGDKDFILRSPQLSQSQRDVIAATLSVGGKNPATISQYTEVGPTIGTELRRKAVLSIVLVLVCILLFIAFAFRKVSEPVSSWIYGLIALVTLLHDVIVPVGFFAALGHFAGAEIDTLFVTAILTVLGFSIHDTIVVFDRVRENLAINKEKGRKEPFSETAGRALSQTFVRSINTSLTVLFTLLVLYLVGPSSTKFFALTLLVGITAGTYSSIVLATPLLVTAERYLARKPKK